MPSILAVDIGTTSAKAIVITHEGNVLSTAREFYSTHRPRPDFAEQDPEEIFQAVLKIIRIAAAQTKEKIETISFSSAMHSLMAVDEQGKSLTPLILWSDLRSTEEAIHIRSVNGHAVYEETGTPIHPMSPLCKILWLKNNQPEIHRKALKFIGIKEYIWFNLFGEFVIDHSVASATGLFNSSKMSWSPAALALAGITKDKLSAPSSVYRIFKTTNARYTTDLGLGKDTSWIIGASDGCLANLGSHAMEDDVLSLTIGTSGAVRKTVRKNSPDPVGRTFHYMLDEDTLVTGGATNNGAILLQWYAENFLKEKINIQSFGDRAARVTAGSNGLIFLPFLFGERAPIFDPEASGVFFGVRHHHGTEHFMRAILEGIGYALFSIAEVVEKNSGGYKRLMASGSFVESPHWVQIIADIFGKEVHVQGQEDASALGAALMGFKALKIESHFQFSAEKTYQSESISHRKYREYFSVYQELYPHLSKDFHRLHSIIKT